MSKKPEEMTLAELCDIAEVQYRTRVELQQQDNDLECQMRVLNNLAGKRAWEEFDHFSQGDIVVDDQGIRYRVTKVMRSRNAQFAEYLSRGATCGPERKPYAPEMWNGFSTFGIRLAKNGTLAHKEDRLLYGKLTKEN